MKVVFCSSYFNHHQRPLSDALYNATNGNFFYIATKTISADRKKIGYGEQDLPDYVLDYTDSAMMEQCLKVIEAADVLIAGACPEDIVQNRIKSGKVVFRYSERPLKNGLQPLKYIPRFIKWRKNNPKKAKLYMLCASAYTAEDYAKFGLFKSRTYKWGYFPQTVEYADIAKHMAAKDKSRILWCGRFLDWKHPDDAIVVAKMLKDAGCSFTMDFIGMGPMEDTMQSMIKEHGLQDCVRILGSMPPVQVRRHMDNAGIYLFTSDRQEGWGAVLNEAMNSGCAVVAANTVGAAPYLLSDSINGCIYKYGDINGLYTNVKALLADPNRQEILGVNAYQTITEVWNAQLAAERFLRLAQCVLQDENTDIYTSGPCSRA